MKKRIVIREVHVKIKGIIQKRSSSKFWLGNAGEFLKKYEVKSKVRKSL